jgi:hypothetical protein
MQIRKTLVALLAVATAFAFSPVPELQAASPFGPGSLSDSDNLTYTVKAKKKMKKAKKAKKGKKAKSGKRAKSKRAGGCGTGMYWSRKARKCESAASKK